MAVNPQQLAVPKDPWLLKGIPDSVPIHRCNALSLRWSSIPFLGTLDFRALRPMRKLGNHLLKTRKFDLVYFSTTVFSLTTLGAYWKKRYGVPFVVDYQDPWVSDYYRERPEITPPGGRFKYGLVDRLSRFQEPRVLQACRGITSVSPEYPKQLAIRYPWLKDLPGLVLPFPGSERDFERIQNEPAVESRFKQERSHRHWVYVGRGGEDMREALAGFFSALRTWRDRNRSQYDRTRVHFIGTSYAPCGKGTETITPVARQYGVDDIVRESTDRVSYGVMLQCLRDADALIMPGSNDPSYTASKLYPYLLAKKPLLAIFHRASSVVQIMNQVGGGKLATFDSETSSNDLAKQIDQKWLLDSQFEQVTPLDPVQFEPFTDRSSARIMCEFFDKLVS